MGATWDAMQPAIAGLKSAADEADAKIADLQEDNADLRAQNADLQAALDECEAGHPPDPEPPTTGFGPHLEPPDGFIYIGCSVPSGDWSGWIGEVGKTPHIWHEYATSGSTFVSDLNNCPRGCIPLINFKPTGSMGLNAYNAILRGDGDGAIDQAASAIKSYGRQMFLAPLHEPENDDSGGGDDEYARAFRYIIERVRARGADNAVSVWNMMGYYGHGSRYNTLYPGDDVVDWIGSDPYVRTDAKVDTWAELFNTASGSFPGFYSWAKPKGKPFMLCEWGIGQPVAATVAPKLLGNDQLTALQASFPLCRALVYWNHEGEADYRVHESDWPGQTMRDFVAKAPFVFDVSSVAKP